MPATPAQATKPRKDFFISYNRADRAWAEWIAWELDEAGYTTIFQAWDFRPGSNWALEMQRAATAAERTIAVLSPDFLASGFTQPEWAAAFAQDPTGENGLLVPVRVRVCEPEGLLRAAIYIDLVDVADEADARERLLGGVRRGRVKPPIAPAFPRSGPDYPPSSSDSGVASGARATQRSATSVLFDAAHGQDRWSEPAILTRGFRSAGQLAAEHAYVPQTLTTTPLHLADLRPHRIVVLTLGPQGEFQLTDEEVDAVKAYVTAGGGLLLLSSYTGDWHHQANLNAITEAYGMTFNRDLVMPATAEVDGMRDDGRLQVFDVRPDSPYVVEAVPANGAAGDEHFGPLVEGVRRVKMLSTCSIGLLARTARPVLQSVPDAQLFEPKPLGVTFLIERWQVRGSGVADVLAAWDGGAGRVVAVGGFKMFLSSFLEHPGFDNARLFDNILAWLGAER